MKYSLLYKKPERDDPSSAVSDLRLDDTLERICGAGSEYFAEIISYPLTNAENIEYRRGILSDLLADAGLYDRLDKVFGRYDRLRGDWVEMRGGAAPRRPDRGSAEASLAAAWASVKATSVFPGTLLSFTRDIADAIGDGAKSEGLRRLRDRCLELSKDGALTELTAAADKFRGTSPETHGVELKINTFYDLEKTSAEIADVFPLSEKKSRKISVFSKKKPDAAGGETEADAALLAADAMYHLDCVLSGVTDRIYSEMYGLSRELCFYRSALKYASFLESKGICVYPELRTDGGTEIDSLYDLRLLAVQDNVVPCDLKLSADDAGLLIRGENGAGKTTFLRSAGAAYLMCQAGLPIPAKAAALTPVRGIYSHFSSAEEDFTPGDTAGRFEGEVRAMSDTLSRAGRGSLILMNEPFQSTEYGEGTRALHGILTVLPEERIRYLLVTHLTELFDAADLTAKRLEFDLKKHDYKILEEPK